MGILKHYNFDTIAIAKKNGGENIPPPTLSNMKKAHATRACCESV
jgi:hypothetical protein